VHCHHNPVTIISTVISGPGAISLRDLIRLRLAGSRPAGFIQCRKL
jgi:hypothetical protein